ncbi:SRPBCC family protein [Actinomadura macra]|uniref:SRPBCC family protein n=1 Tax=Actinomadura macra TaxID=46164 RepID=UPI00082B8B5A|nr:SRPBCC family protein [Actinomadura macra]
MELDHDFTVPVPVDQGWQVLLDVERVATCMPGATLDSIDGEEYTGRLKVKVGAMTITYRGTARIVSADESSRTVTLEAAAKEARGPGTASATVQARLHEEEDGTTRVTVHTKLNVTGRPAQFGRNILSEVGSKIIDRFAKALAAELESPASAKAPKATEAKATTKPATRTNGSPQPKTTPKAGSAKKNAASEKAPKPKPTTRAEPTPDTEAAPQTGPTAGTEQASKAEPTSSSASEAEHPAKADPAPQKAKADSAEPVTPTSDQPAEKHTQSDDAIDLLEFAGPSLAKRAVPAMGGLVVLAVAVRYLTRRRKRR